MHRLVPAYILQKYRAHEFQGKFTAVGMFLDIYGFSTMTDALMQHGNHGAEVLGTMMRNVFDPLLMAIHEQGGAIIGLAGDGLMALFPFEEDGRLALQQALASAWNMQHHLHSHPERQTTYGSFPISARIGLSMGEVEWGILKSRDSSRATYYFRGPAVDEASAAEQHARAGEIVLTPHLCEYYGDGLVLQTRYEYCALERISAPLPPMHPAELPPIDIETARIFIPDILLGDSLNSEFRQAVNLFVRFPDLDDTELPELVATLFDLQSRYGGLFTRLDFGDKGCNMLIFWGAPVAYQNDIGRALNFITDLQESLNSPLQAGVTYHLSRAGYMGGELHEDYTCYGWGINLASRFMMSAPPGQVWVDERVAQRVRRRFLFEYIEEQRFKGFAQKQKVYSLKGRKPQLEINYEGSLVGRQAELQKLDEFIAPLWQGQGAGTMIVWGEPGVGKSRLLYEWMRSRHQATQTPTWVVCQSDQVLQQSFNPFRYWLRQYFKLMEMDFNPEESSSPDLLASRIDQKLDLLIASIHDPTLAAELDRLRSFLGALVGASWQDSLYKQLDPQARYDNTLLALTRLIEAESLLHPVVLVFEDVHFLDDDSLAFLPRLQRALKSAPVQRPVALLLTARHQDSALRLDPTLTSHTLELEHLHPNELLTLAANLLEGPIAPGLANILETRAEGNPFFAEQLLHYLSDQNLLEWSAQGWRAISAWNPTMLPTDISAVIVARLDQLAGEVKAVIQTAAVLGREFEVLVLAHMLRDDDNLSSELDEAERAAIWLPMSQIRYLFKHALVCDTAYNMQMQARRCELHTLAVEALERLYAESLPDQIDNLAYHSEAARLEEKARRYLEQAGDAARDTYQNARAEDFYTRALAWTTEEDSEARFRLLASREAMLKLRGQPAARLRDLDKMQDLAEGLQAKEKIIVTQIRLAEYHRDTGNYPLAEQIARKVLTFAEEEQQIELSLLASNILMIALHQQSKYAQAITHGKLALEIAENNQSLNRQADLLNTIGMIMLETKEPRLATGYFEKSLAIYRNINKLRGILSALNNLGLSATYQGKYLEAQSYYEQARQSNSLLGNQQDEGKITGNLGWLASLQGDYALAKSYIERNIAIAQELADVLSKTYGLINLSAIACVQGEAIPAQHTAEQALQLARQSNDRNAEAWALTYQGHSLMAVENLPAAKIAYQQAVALRQELEQPVLACEPQAGLLRLSLAQQEMESLSAGLSEILPILESHPGLDGTDEPLRVYLNCYLALSALNDSRAPGLLEKAQQLLKQRAANIADAAARQQFLEQVPWNRAICALAGQLTL